MVFWNENIELYKLCFLEIHVDLHHSVTLRINNYKIYNYLFITSKVMTPVCDKWFRAIFTWENKLSYIFIFLFFIFTSWWKALFECVTFFCRTPRGDWFWFIVTIHTQINSSYVPSSKLGLVSFGHIKSKSFTIFLTAF